MGRRNTRQITQALFLSGLVAIGSVLVWKTLRKPPGANEGEKKAERVVATAPATAPAKAMYNDVLYANAFEVKGKSTDLELETSVKMPSHNGVPLVITRFSNKGSWVEFDLPKVKPGPYRLFAFFTRNVRSGSVKFSFNRRGVGDPQELFSKTEKLSGPLHLGVVNAGAANTLKLELVSRYPHSTGYEFAFEGIHLDPL